MYPPALRRATRLVLLAILAAACAPKEAKQATRPACTVPSDSIVPGAVSEYITSLNTPIGKFMVSVGTDSALPERAWSSLQALGSIRMLPGDPTQQAALLREMMGAPSRSLLIAYHGTKAVGVDTVDVMFSGAFIGTATLKPTPSRTIRFTCDSNVVHFTVLGASTPK